MFLAAKIACEPKPEQNQVCEVRLIPGLLFSPLSRIRAFELVFGRTVRGPLKLLEEKWLNDENNTNLLDYVSNFKHGLDRAIETTRENLKVARSK